MDEDTEYLKLPLEERMVHKLWKARLSAYEETKKLFGQVSSHIFTFQWVLIARIPIQTNKLSSGLVPTN